MIKASINGWQEQTVLKRVSCTVSFLLLEWKKCCVAETGTYFLSLLISVVFFLYLRILSPHLKGCSIPSAYFINALVFLAHTYANTHLLTHLSLPFHSLSHSRMAKKKRRNPIGDERTCLKKINMNFLLLLISHQRGCE